MTVYCCIAGQSGTSAQLPEINYPKFEQCQMVRSIPHSYDSFHLFTLYPLASFLGYLAVTCQRHAKDVHLLADCHLVYYWLMDYMDKAGYVIFVEGC